MMLTRRAVIVALGLIAAPALAQTETSAPVPAPVPTPVRADPVVTPDGDTLAWCRPAALWANTDALASVRAIASPIVIDFMVVVPF